MNSFPSVLYVEDDALSRMVVEIILKEVMGLSNIVIFKDSANFENQLNSIPFQVDLILLDIQVKPLTGFDMIQILRRHARYQNLPIVALTASVMSEEVETLRSSGFNSLIPKPIDEQDLPAQLMQILSGKEFWTIV